MNTGVLNTWRLLAQVEDSAENPPYADQRALSTQSCASSSLASRMLRAKRRVACRVTQAASLLSEQRRLVFFHPVTISPFPLSHPIFQGNKQHHHHLIPSSRASCRQQTHSQPQHSSHRSSKASSKDLARSRSTHALAAPTMRTSLHQSGPKLSLVSCFRT